MEPTAIPDDLRRFILLRIPSIPYLEALLLMREDATRWWDSGALAQRLYLGVAACDDLLLQLHADGVAARDPAGAARYRYAPEHGQLAAMLDRLAPVYARRLVEVSTLVHSKSGRKAQVFADAFVWRKEKK